MIGEVTQETKEQIHDRLISPLVNELMDICQKYNINFLATFDITDVKDEEGKEPGDVDKFYCTTSMVRPENGSKPHAICMATDVMIHGPAALQQKILLGAIGKVASALKVAQEQAEDKPNNDG